MRNRFLELMENVDPNYQAPIDPNSGSGLTKFAPSPASTVLKSYNVDDGFLRNAMTWAGGQPQAIDQVLGALGNAGNGVLGGQHFDNVIATFTAPGGQLGSGAQMGTATNGVVAPQALGGVTIGGGDVAPVDAIDAGPAGNGSVAPNEPPSMVQPDSVTTAVDPATGPTNIEPPVDGPEVTPPPVAGDVGADDEEGEEKPVDENNPDTDMRNEQPPKTTSWK